MRNKGFTLIELIVTISILCIALATTVLIIDMDIFYLEKMADEFAADVRYVQMKCMKGATYNYRIGIDIDSRCYYVFNNTDVEKTVLFKSRYQIDYSNQNIGAIGFTHDGTPVNSGTFTILDTRTNKTKQVSIVPTTGRMVIKE